MISSEEINRLNAKLYSIGEEVEYVNNTDYHGNDRYNGSRGVVHKFDNDSPTCIYVRWISGKIMETSYGDGNAHSFHKFVIKRTELTYDPKQAGDTDDDI